MQTEIMVDDSKYIFKLLIVILLCHFVLAEDPYTDTNNNDYNDANANVLDDGSDTVGIEQPDVKSKEDPMSYSTGGKQDDCWLTLNAAEHFKAMNKLDKKYFNARQTYKQNVETDLNSDMLQELLSTRGAAPRAVHNYGGNAFLIPAGINLGGHSMMRLKDSLLFFYRMKLRNSTNFRVNYLHNNLMSMTMRMSLSLNDLHLIGSYERSATHKDPSVLYYRPSYGSVELLLRNVSYTMEARMRMMSDRLTIELVTSKLKIDDALMSYLNTNFTNLPEYTVRVEADNIDDYLQIMKTDLDLWLKDYFNDFLMYFDLPPYDHSQIQEYEIKKTILLNEYVNYAVNAIRNKIFQLGGSALKLPKFTLFSVPNMVIRIKDGVLRGLDTMYRRSMGTGRSAGKMRFVDVIIGFSKLKVEYKFEAILPNGSPPLSGVLTMSANELTAHLGITLVRHPESVDLNFDFIRQMMPESLTVEGPASRVIANFKHQLENHIIALMSNSLIHYVKMLTTTTRCVPLLYAHRDEDPYLSNENSDNYYDQDRRGKSRTRTESPTENSKKILQRFKKA